MHCSRPKRRANWAQPRFGRQRIARRNFAGCCGRRSSWPRMEPRIARKLGSLFDCFPRGLGRFAPRNWAC